MDAANEFFSQLKSGVKDINTCILGVIEEYDKDEMLAKVQPLYDNYPLLIEVPVMMLKSGPFYIIPQYKEGDLVVVAFSDKDIDNAVRVKPIEKSMRNNALEDAIVIGGINPQDEDIDTLDIPNDRLVIGVQGKSYIALSEEGDIDIKARNVTIDSESFDYPGKGDGEVDKLED